MKIEWHKVTWYSKLLAVIVFVGIFFWGFYLGAQYQAAKPINPPPASIPSQTNHDNGNKICRSDNDCLPSESCEVVGPLTYPATPKVCWPKGQVHPL